MNFSFTNKIRAVLVLLFSISVLEGLIILQICKFAKIDIAIMRNIQNTIFISTFIVLVLALLLFFYIPVFLKKVMSNIHDVINEISLGNYKLDIDLDFYKEHMDNEFYQVVVSLKEMLKYILRFDELKKEKVIEQKSRIDSIIALSSEGFIVLNHRGEIIYINKILMEHFPVMEQNLNIVETNFNQDVESSIKKYCLELLKEKTKLESRQFFIPFLKRHITLQSALVKNLKGTVIGGVICVSNLSVPKKKIEKSKEIKNDN